MANINYEKLYQLQDKILNIIFSKETEFYLTGGTCLNRFYYNERLSDDLDFFTNFSNRFSFSLNDILATLPEHSLDFQVEADSKDYKKVIVNDGGQTLQLDFVNDRVKRFGDIIINGKGYKLDNIKNILSNKITAVISRDNPKDIFDIYLIALNTNFFWGEILLNAKEKMSFSKEQFIYRLKQFPPELLNKIKPINPQFLKNFDNIFPLIINDIIAENNNSHTKN